MSSNLTPSAKVAHFRWEWEVWFQHVRSRWLRKRERPYLYRAWDGGTTILAIDPRALEKQRVGIGVPARLVETIRTGSWLPWPRHVGQSARWREYVHIFPKAWYVVALEPLPPFLLLLEV